MTPSRPDRHPCPALIFDGGVPIAPTIGTPGRRVKRWIAYATSTDKAGRFEVKVTVYAKDIFKARDAIVAAGFGFTGAIVRVR